MYMQETVATQQGERQQHAVAHGVVHMLLDTNNPKL